MGVSLIFRSLKTEWIPDTGDSTRPEAQKYISRYLMGYYNEYWPQANNGGL